MATMESVGSPSIGGIVEFLHRFAPQRLDGLRTEFPSVAAKEILQPGEMLGSETVDGTELRLKAAHQAMQAIREASQNVLPRARARLRSARRLGFFAELVTLVGGSSTVVAALQAALSKAAVLISAAITLLGALASSGRSFYLAVLGDSSRTADTLYRTLLETSVEADRLATEILISLETKDKTDMATKLVQQANDLSRSAAQALDEFK